MKNITKEEVQIVSTICKCERCSRLLSQPEPQNKFLTYEEMFDVADKRYGVLK